MIVWLEEKFGDGVVILGEVIACCLDLVCLQILAEVITNYIPTFLKLNKGVAL